MRYAIFSDIHGNREAWRRVLADIRSLEAEVLVCLGDVVGYGPLPEEVLSEIRAVTPNFVIGNHDAAAIGKLDSSIFNDHARSVIEWTARRLSPESHAFLAGVPLAMEADEMLFVHAEVSEPARFGYITDEASAAENFASGHHFVTFVGHTHEPAVFALGEGGGVTRMNDADGRLREDRRYIVNVGSVGDPRNPEDLRGCYVIYDSETRDLYFRRIQFDVESYRRDLAATSLEISPYFLHVGDQLLDDAMAAVDMEAPAGMTQGTLGQDSPVQLHMPQAAQAGQSRKPLPKPRPAAGSSKKRALMVTMGCTLVLLAAGVFAWFRMGPGRDDGNIRTVQPPNPVAENTGPAPEPPAAKPGADEATANEPSPDEAEAGVLGSPWVAPDAAARTAVTPAPEPAPTPPKPEPEPPAAATAATPGQAPDPADQPPEPPPTNKDGVVAWWRMEADSAGARLIDSLERHSLPMVAAGSPIENQAPDPLPRTGDPNTGAMSLGVWQEADPEGVFHLSASRSFTLEGWLLSDRTRKPIFVAGTRTGEADENIGWHIDLRPSSHGASAGQMGFFYDNGSDPTVALSEDVRVTDLKPRHFAAVWDHAGSDDAGEMRLYLEGELIASERLPHAVIAESQVNPFRIGSPANPPRVALDELRFSHQAIRPQRFLGGGARPSYNEIGVIGDVKATASSTYNQIRTPPKLVNNSGLSEPGSLSATHGVQSGDQWLSKENVVSGATVTFDLGGPHYVTAMHIWQANQQGRYLIRGVKQFDVLGSTDGGANFSPILTDQTLAVSKGGNNSAQVFELEKAKLTHVKLLIHSNHGGHHVGLSEVKFEGAPQE